MAATIVDLGVLVLTLGMTYALMSEGLWGACLMFFNALFAAMITMNCYEPLAQVIGSNVEFLSGFADALSIMLIYTLTLLAIRLTTENFAPSMVRFPMPLFHLGRVLFGLLGSAITMGMILIAMDASPVDKTILGAMDYKYKPFFGLRLDKEILAYFQHASGYIFTRNGNPDPFKEFGSAPDHKVRVFDPRGDWLLREQEARPYPKGQDLFAEETASSAGAEGAAAKEGAGQPGAPGAPGAPAPNQPGLPGGVATPGMGP